MHQLPDFAAEHADISTGGIGAFGDWTLTLVRTEKGEELFNDMEAAGVIETRPIEDDPGAVTLLNKLSRVSRKRWPATAVPMPGRLPPPASTPDEPDQRPPGRRFAAFLGIEVVRRGPGHTVAALTTDVRHANPHGTVHGAVFYAVAGAAVAAAANDAENSGIISSVLVEYLQPAALGNRLYAEVSREVSTRREDIFTGTVRRGAGATCSPGCGPVAPPGPARAEQEPGAAESTVRVRSPRDRGSAEGARWPNLWESGH